MPEIFERVDFWSDYFMVWCYIFNQVNARVEKKFSKKKKYFVKRIELQASVEKNYYILVMSIT
jgi:predicted DsbA family dithiol-disulfide isomerase